ncbi:MAG: hypothetical protein IAX21_11295 [Candidatus Bathyarchaeota archaeon]|nr:MAG: hypothetical protein IAX21_11295 [Candidatus Bathyarchaeota archaeon]
MKISRLGLIVLIVGLVVLLNSWSSHVPRYSITSLGDVEPSETLNLSIHIAPVGTGNLTIGSTLQTGSSMPPELGMDDSIVLHVHLVVQGPRNQTLLEKDVVTPYSNRINFTERGEFTVHITNMGTESSRIPTGVIFPETDDASNRETDKFTISIILIICGLALICIKLTKGYFVEKGLFS